MATATSGNYSSTRMLMEEKYNSILSTKNGKWSITPNDIYLIFKYESSLRTMNIAELVSLKTQMNVSIPRSDQKSQDQESQDPLTTFQNILKDLKNYQSIYLFLNHKGLKLFTVIQNENFNDLQNLFSTFKDHPKFNPANEIQETFLYANKIRPQSYKVIGYLLQQYCTTGSSTHLQPFITCILGWNPQKGLDFETFFKTVPDQIFFDAAQLGQSFCRYLQNLQCVNFTRLTTPDFPGSDSFRQKVQNITDKSHLIFCKVQRPAHCYHCIIPLFNMINKSNISNKSDESNESDKSNQSNQYKLFILFCTKDREFAHVLNQIPKTSGNKTIQNTVFFIVHPELLNNENRSLLHEFITTRIRTKDLNLPKVFVISSDYQFSKSPDSIDEQLYRKSTIEINDTDEIEIMYKLSIVEQTIKPYLYYSEQAGLGKTHRIRKDIYAKYITKAKSKEAYQPESFFLDENMKYLPRFNSEYVHFDLSPALFDDKYEFFDALWTYCTLKYHFYEDGTAANQVKYVYFEVPTLTESQIGKETFRYQDFPIVVNKMIKIKSDGTTEIIRPKVMNTKEERSLSFLNFKKTLKAKQLYFSFQEQVWQFCQAYFDNQNDIESVINIIVSHSTKLNYDFENKSVSIHLKQLNQEEKNKITTRNISLNNNVLTFKIPFNSNSDYNMEFITRFFGSNQQLTKTIGSSINFIIETDSQYVDVKSKIDYKCLFSGIFKSPQKKFMSKVIGIDYSIVNRNSLIVLTFKNKPEVFPALKEYYEYSNQNDNRILIVGKNVTPIVFTELGKRFIDSLKFVSPFNKVSILLNETQIRLSPRIQTLCNSIFKSNISNISTLLSVASKLFFSKIQGYAAKNEFFPLRIQKEVSTFLEKFCEYLPIDFNSSRFIFLLLLRTCFYIYNMDSFFIKTGIKLPNSWIIILPKYLFGTIEKLNLWVLFYFQAGEPKVDWDVSLLKNQKKTHDLSFIKSNPNNDLITIFSNAPEIKTEFEEQAYIYFYMIEALFTNDSNTAFSQQLDKIIAKKIPKNVGIKQKTIIQQTTKRQEIIDKLYKKYQKSLLKNAPTQDFGHYYLSETGFEDPYNLSQMCFTIPLFKRFLIVLLNVYNGQSLIFEGSTGIGKTQIVKFLENLFNLLNTTGNQPKWNFKSIDCHGDLQIQQIEKIIKEHQLQNQVDHMTFFFDELNTSPAVCNVINKMLNSSHYRNTSFLAAINPYEKVPEFSRYISRVGITQINNVKISQLKLSHITPTDEALFYKNEDINEYAYNVRELDPSTKMIVLPSDPQPFNSCGNSQDNKYLPNEEKVIIQNLIHDSLIQLNTQLMAYFKSKINKLTVSDDYKMFMLNREQRKDVSEIVTLVIEEVFTTVRKLMNLKHILAYRDVKRFMMHFINFYCKLARDYLSSYSLDDINFEEDKKLIISRSFVLSFMLTIAFRFSNYTRLPKTRNIGKQEIYEINGFQLPIAEKNQEYIKVQIRQALLDLLSNKIKATPPSIPLPDTKDWIGIVLSYSYIKFSKYITENVYKTRPLMIHLFAVSSCYSVSKHFPNEPMPCLIIGMPGTSKTLGINLFIEHKRSKKNCSTFFSTTYLSTRASEAEGLNSHYRDCAMFLMKNKKDNPRSICVIDELGLANLNENRPLKLLHYYFDKGIPIELSSNTTQTLPVMSIAASNYALDYANMNRGILICTDLPSDEELIEAWERKKIKIPKHYFENLSWDVLKALAKAKSSQTKVNGRLFLQELWTLTDTKVRPDKIALRPLFMLYSLLNVDAPNLVSICSYLTPVLSCHPNETYQKALSLINHLELNIPTLKKSLQNCINYSVFRKFLKFWLNESRTVRSLCIRTRQYEARDYLIDLLRKVISPKKDFEICSLFPNDFQQTKAQAADRALKTIINVITNKDRTSNCSNKKHIFLVTGNASFADGLLDLLNYSDENAVSSREVLISRNGFSISLPEIPSNILFIFLINESDFHKQDLVDSIPLPLLDRLTQVYFDYNINIKPQQNNKKFENLIEQYKTARKTDVKSESFKFRKSVSTRFLKTHQTENWPPVQCPNPGCILTECVKTNHQYLKTIDSVKKQRTDRNKKRKMPKPKSLMYRFNYDSRDAIFRHFSKATSKDLQPIKQVLTLPPEIRKAEKPIIDLMDKNPRVIILTISPLMEPLNNVSITPFYDSYIQSTKQFEQNIKRLLAQHQDSKNKLYIAIRMKSPFSLDYHQQIRWLLENIQNYNKDKNSNPIADVRVAIIYHLKANSLPIGLNPSLNWPVFWCDYITNSPVSTFPIEIIYQSVLFADAYNEYRPKIFFAAIKQSYDIVLTQSITENRYQFEVESSKLNDVIEKVILLYIEKDQNNLNPDFSPFLRAAFYEENLTFEKIITTIIKTLKQDPENQLDEHILLFFKEFKGYVDYNQKKISIEMLNKFLTDYNAGGQDNQLKLDSKAKNILNRSLYDPNNPINKLNDIIIESEPFDIKRHFFDIINNALPNYVTNFVLLTLLLETTPLFYEEYQTDQELKNTEKFFSGLFKEEFLRNKFLNRITNLPTQCPKGVKIYFPELIRPEIETLLSMDYTGPLDPLFDTIDELKQLQPNKDHFFRNYLDYYTTNHKGDFANLTMNEEYFEVFKELLLIRGKRRIKSMYTDPEDGKLHNIEHNSYRDYLNSMVSNLVNDSFKSSNNSDTHLSTLFYCLHLKSLLIEDPSSFTLENNNPVNILRYLILSHPYDKFDFPEQFVKRIKDKHFHNNQNYKDFLEYKKYIESGFDSSKKSTGTNGQFEYETITTFVTSKNCDDIVNDIKPKIQGCQFPIYVSSKAFINSTEKITSPLTKIRDTILRHADNTPSFIKSYQESYQRWLFNSKAPLFVRQLTSLLIAIQKNDNREIHREMIVMSLLLNPWNNDSQVLKAFMSLLREKIEDIIKGSITFDKMKTLIFDRIGRRIFNDDTNSKSLQNAILNGEMYFIEYKAKAGETTANESNQNQSGVQSYEPNKCNKPEFCAEVEGQIDRLIFSLSIMETASQKGSDAYQSCQFFKTISFLKLIKDDLIFIKEFSATLQKEFVYELDKIYLILSALNCEDLSKIETHFNEFQEYRNIQATINSRKQLFQDIQNFYNQKFANAYDMINRYTNKLVKFYNNVFERYATKSPVIFTEFSPTQKNEFDYQYTILPSLYLLTINNQPGILHRFINFMNPKNGVSYEINLDSGTQTVNQTIISFMPTNDNVANPTHISAIYYPKGLDFMGFTKEIFNQSIFSRLDINSEVAKDSPIRTKVFHLIVGSKFPAEKKKDNFDVLIYLLMLFSESSSFYNKEPFEKVHNLCKLLTNRSRNPKRTIRGNADIIDFLNKNYPGSTESRFKKAT